MKRAVVALIFLFLLCTVQGSIAAGPKAGEGLNKQSRCPVCGMFVAKYPQWLAQINMSDGHAEFFDGAKDMLAYYFSPGQYGAAAGAMVEEVFVRDYYSQDWIDGQKAFYVLGSDVYGPMGHELPPFSGQEAAENFLKDHHGSKIYGFAEITPEIIESLRKGHTMKDHTMKDHTMKGHSMPAKK